MNNVARITYTDCTSNPIHFSSLDRFDSDLNLRCNEAVLFHIQDFNAYSAECDRFTDHVRAIIAALPDDVEIGRGAVFGQALRQMGHDPASVMV